MPCGGKVAPVYRLQPAGLYVALPVTSTLSGASDASNEFTHIPRTNNEEEASPQSHQHSTLYASIQGPAPGPKCCFSECRKALKAVGASHLFGHALLL